MDEWMADGRALCCGIVDLERLAELVLGPHRAFHGERDSRVAQDDHRGVVGVGGSVVLVGRVEEDSRPCEYKAVVRLRYIKDHLVLARDLVQPGLELRLGAGARHPSRDRKSTRLTSSHTTISYS